ADLPALYAGYYIAELLADWTEDYDPHPMLFDEARAALRELGTSASTTARRWPASELVPLGELATSPSPDPSAVSAARWTGSGWRSASPRGACSVRSASRDSGNAGR